jgi:hypothetical protein
MNKEIKYGVGYYVIFKNLIFNGLLTADKNVPEKSQNGIFLYLQITKDEHSMYLQALKDKKEIYIDDDGKIQIRYKLEE